MQLLVFLAADYANVAVGGKLNVMGVFREIHARQFPIRHAMMHLVIKLGGELGETSEPRTLLVKLLDEDGAELMNLSQGFELPQGHGGLRPEVNFIYGLNDLVFPHAGAYDFVVQVDRHTLGTLTIYVSELPPEVDDKSEGR